MATQKVFEPLRADDPYAIQHREQLIGESSAYLFIGTKIADDILQLQQLTQDHVNS